MKARIKYEKENGTKTDADCIVMFERDNNTGEQTIILLDIGVYETVTYRIELTADDAAKMAHILKR